MYNGVLKMIRLNGFYRSVENDPLGNGGLYSFKNKLADKLPNGLFIVSIELTNELDQIELYDLIVADAGYNDCD